MVEFDDHKPIYIQIYEDLLTQIFREELELGDKLPSVRDLAIAYTVNPTTIQRVISELDAHHLITKERGKGTFLTTEESVINEIKQHVIKKEINYFMDKLTKMGLKKPEIIKEINTFNDEGEEA